MERESVSLIPLSLIQSDVMTEMLKEASQTPTGCFVEVGVYQGGSAYFLSKIALEQGRAFYGYDTFAGVPHATDADRHQVGEFADTSIMAVSQAIPHGIFIAGVFPLSAVPMPPIAFAHIDCDQYQSVKDALLYLAPSMGPGGILWFDDYGEIEEAKRAVDECGVGRLEPRIGSRQIVRCA